MATPGEKLLPTIDDPQGLVRGIPEEHHNEEDATRYVVERLQEMRWELHGMMVDLDTVEPLTAASAMLIPQAIALLGVAARAEALWVDESDGSSGRLFAPQTLEDS